MEKQLNESLAYDEQFVWRLVEKIIIYEGRLAVEFKSELEIEVKRYSLEMLKCLAVRQ